MSDVPLASPVQAPDGTIQGDLACVRCGYNLRGLKSDKACPECFTPVESSLHGNLLAYADQDWLECLRKGTSLKLWNIALAIVSAVAVMILTAVGGPKAFALLVSLPTACLGLWAAFLITAQEPRVSLEEDPVTLRRVIRVCAAIGFLGNLLTEFHKNIGFSGVPTALVVATGSLFVLVGIVAYFGEFIYYRRFARRIPNVKLARDTTTVMWGFVICAVALVLGGGLVAIVAVGGTAGRGVAAGGGVCLCGAGVAMLVFAVWYITLLVQYRNVFAEAAARKSDTVPGSQTR
jgi:hypothetical protein